MRVSMQNICQFAKTLPNRKSFIGGEGFLNAGHVINCGKVFSNNESVNACSDFSILAFCLKTSNLKDNPHEITGKITREGEILSNVCSCKAGLSGACKHVVAVLLQVRIYYNTLLIYHLITNLNLFEFAFNNSHRYLLK